MKLRTLVLTVGVESLRRNIVEIGREITILPGDNEVTKTTFRQRCDAWIVLGDLLAIPSAKNLGIADHSPTMEHTEEPES